MPSIDVVVVAYNSRATLRACAEPLAGRPGVSVLVVDNACPERSFEVVADLPGVRVIHLPRNGGFAYGCNAGWRAGDAEFVLFVNPDARLGADALARLARTLESDHGTGVTGPRTLRSDASLQWTIRRFPSLRSTYCRALFLHHLAPRASWVDEVVRDPARYERSGHADWLSGSCLLVRRSALEAVGGFDERFFLYVEDLDLCRRVRSAGFDVVYVSDAVCVHEGGRSMPRARLLPLLAASRLRYAKLQRGQIGAILERIGIGIGEALRAVVGRGGQGVRRGHLRAVGVMLQSDDGYRPPYAVDVEARKQDQRVPAPQPRGRLGGVRLHFRSHRAAWLLVALLAAAANEAVDEIIWHERHIDLDIVVAICAVTLAFFASYFARQKDPNREPAEHA